MIYNSLLLQLDSSMHNTQNITQLHYAILTIKNNQGKMFLTLCLKNERKIHLCHEHSLKGQTNKHKL